MFKSVQNQTDFRSQKIQPVLRGGKNQTDFRDGKNKIM